MANDRGTHFQLKDLQKPENHHYWLILFWPVYLITFILLERVIPADYHQVYIALDDMIPFCEFFIVPYLLWFIYWIGMLFLLLLKDVPVFKKMMLYMIVTYTISLICYFVWPTCQNLRPEAFPRDNVFSWAVGLIYSVDTSTNVCPSEHILACVGAMLASYRSSLFAKRPRRAVMTVLGILICISTVFVKQHSALDLFAALPVCLIGYFVAFRKKKRQ